MYIQYIIFLHNTFTGYGQSRMFSRAPMHIMQSLANEPITANFHQYCVTEQVKKLLLMIVY